jgi:hypothetical protein
VRKKGPLRPLVVGGLVLGALAVTPACGGESRQSSGSGGLGAAAGAGGSSGARPTAGVGGATGGTASGSGGSGAGSGGTAGGTAGASAGSVAAGDGGISGSGGRAGAAGGGGAPNGGAAGVLGVAGSGYPECRTADDCVLASDCCGCRSIPRDGRELCALDCVRDPCQEMEIVPGEVECAHGRCVLARSCAGSVTCPALPEVCPVGTVPSVVDECWGPCLSPTDCRNVNGCADCGDAFCVEFQAHSSSFSCVTRVDECDRDNYCECLGVCGACTEADDAVACPCLGC